MADFGQGQGRNTSTYLNRTSTCSWRLTPTNRVSRPSRSISCGSISYATGVLPKARFSRQFSYSPGITPQSSRQITICAYTRKTLSRPTARSAFRSRMNLRTVTQTRTTAHDRRTRRDIPSPRFPAPRKVARVRAPSYNYAVQQVVCRCVANRTIPRHRHTKFRSRDTACPGARRVAYRRAWRSGQDLENADRGIAPSGSNVYVYNHCKAVSPRRADLNFAYAFSIHRLSHEMWPDLSVSCLFRLSNYCEDEPGLRQGANAGLPEHSACPRRVPWCSRGAA